MNGIQRASGIRRILRRITLNAPETKYVTAGDRACRGLMQAARGLKRLRADSEDRSILAWARYELAAETAAGFWDRRAAYPV